MYTNQETSSIEIGSKTCEGGKGWLNLLLVFDEYLSELAAGTTGKHI